MDNKGIILGIYYWKLNKRVLNSKRGGGEKTYQITKFLEFQGNGNYQNLWDLKQ